jgi:preprotein translocase subunit SecA
MAGRGTDIMLGGNAEFMAVAALAAKGLDPVANPDEYQTAWAPAFEEVKKDVATEAAKVIAAGGLYVLGTERHESRRIDNQLRGRSGRQGDPGESRFYLSLTDDLMRLFNSGMAESFMGRGLDDTAIESKIVSRAIRSAQSQVEARNAEVRKNVLKYDDVLNRQREAIYHDRGRILEGDDLRDRALDFISDVIDDAINVHCGQGNGDDWDFDALWAELRTIYPVSITIDEVIAEAGTKGRVNRDFMRREIQSDASLSYARRESTLGAPAMRELERRVVLSVIDRRWRDHLYEMDYLKDGIGLRAMAQRDPLVEYQREGFALYSAMMEGIKTESVGFLYNLEVQVQVPAGDPSHPSIAAKGLDGMAAPTQLSYTAPNEDGQAEIRDQRGQVEQAATERARQAEAAQRPITPERTQPTGQPAQTGGGRGAFGQRVDGEAPPMNRRDRRSKGR